MQTPKPTPLTSRASRSKSMEEFRNAPMKDHLKALAKESPAKTPTRTPGSTLRSNTKLKAVPMCNPGGRKLNFNDDDVE